MNSDDYLHLSTRSESVDVEQIFKRLARIGTVRLLHAAIGLSTESGEFSDQLKRHVFYGKELDKTNLKEEAGDLLWYLSIALNEIGSSFSEVMAMNIAKLKARYPEKFSELKAEERDLAKEAEAMAQAQTSGAVVGASGEVIGVTAPRCTCGSGMHPRHCLVHPKRYEAHCAEISEESLFSED